MQKTSFLYLGLSQTFPEQFHLYGHRKQAWSKAYFRCSQAYYNRLKAHHARHGIIRILDANGKVVAEATTSVVKDTGANMAVTVSVVSLLAVALIGCAVAGKKFAAR